MSRELAEIAIVVQGFAINHLNLHPSNEMLVPNMSVAKPGDDVRYTKILNRLQPTLKSEVQPDFLGRLIKRLWVNGIKQESISLIIGNEKVPVPKELRFKTVASLLLRLKRLNIERKVAAREQMKSVRKQLFIAVEQSVDQYVQSLNFDPTEHQTSQSAPFITAIVLLAAGYLKTVDDYQPSNKKIETTKYCTYREIMNMQRAKTKMKFALDIRSFDLPLN